jgi:hypothetical protein
MDRAEDKAAVAVWAVVAVEVARVVVWAAGLPKDQVGTANAPAAGTKKRTRYRHHVITGSAPNAAL